MLVPELQELVELQAEARGLSLHAHRAAMARLPGGHRSAQRGRGLEFEEVRPYAAGDDARLIDWRVTARRGKVHTKLFREEAERPVWVLADLHPALFFGSRRQTKSAALVRAAGLLAWVAALGGDRVGAVIANGVEAPRILRPRGRQAGVLALFEALIEMQPRAPAAAQPQTLLATLRSAAPLIQPGSLLLLLSDFHELDEDSEQLLAALSLRSELRLLWVTDPLEAAGLPSGSFRVGLPGRSWWLNGNDVGAAWRAAWAEREQRLQALAERSNLPLTRLDTADAITQVLPPLLRTPRWAA